ncbi:MAG: type II secretion system F family protein [Dehalococcoidales bacterium]|nr:type II secretion system F family protein [Dehalococcoidales bacterium]
MTYRYQAYTASKKLVDGTIEAANETLAEEALYQAGYKYIISLKAARPRATVAALIPTLFGVKTQDVIEFSRQLATFVESGVSLHMALQLVEEQVSKQALKAIVSGLARKLQEGSSLSQALSHYPEAFPYSYYQIVRASEQAGDLEGGLRQMAEYMERQMKMNQNIRRAMAYPAIVTVMAIGVFILMMTLVLPPILGLFSSLGASLPWTTKLIIAIVGFFTDYKLQIFIAIVVIIAAIVIYLRFPSGKLMMDKLKLHLPFIGKIVVQRTMGHFCRTTSMMLRSGLQLPTIMDIMIQTVSTNQIVSRALTEVRDKLVEGQGMSRPMSENPLFPKTMVRMIAMGEQTGNIDTALSTMAVFYEERANQNVQSLISMIEPTLTIVMGLCVAFILVSILMPMYSVLNSLR